MPLAVKVAEEGAVGARVDGVGEVEEKHLGEFELVQVKVGRGRARRRGEERRGEKRREEET